MKKKGSAIMARYFTLCVFEDGRWSPEFGDYDRAVVEQERLDCGYDGYLCDIICTGEDQAAIDDAVSQLNKSVEEEAREEEANNGPFGVGA